MQLHRQGNGGGIKWKEESKESQMTREMRGSEIVWSGCEYL